MKTKATIRFIVRRNEGATTVAPDAQKGGAAL